MLTFNFYHNDGLVLAKLKLKNKIVKFIFLSFVRENHIAIPLRWLLIEWPQLSTLSIDSEKFESLENTLHGTLSKLTRYPMAYILNDFIA